MTTRRQFLAGSLGLGGSAALASLMPAFAQSTGDYKALVCIFMRGGMDGHDTIIPIHASGYRDWSAVRAPLLDRYAEAGDDSRTREALIPLGAAGSDGRQYGMPRQLSELADLYGQGKLAVMANVGPLEEHTNRAATSDKTAALPPRLMSHNDQMSVWETLFPEGQGLGWGGLFADAMSEGSSYYDAVVVGASSDFVAGRKTAPYQLGKSAVTPVFGTLENGAFGSSGVPEILAEHFTASASSMNNLLASDFALAQRRAVEATNDLALKMEGTTAGDSAILPGNALSESLAAVAKMISLRATLGVRRQIYFVAQNGYDTHADQFTRLPTLHAELGPALKAFYDTTVELGVQNMVTTFTASDFGRTLQPNASGTDHGWGGHQLVMGGGVAGGRIAGQMPETALGHDQDFDRGRLIPTTAIEQYGSALGRWFGIGESDLDTIFPKRSRFDAPPALFA